MYVSFDPAYQEYTNGLARIEFNEQATLKGVMFKVFSRFPQLFVKFQESREFKDQTLLLVNDSEIIEISDLDMPFKETDELQFMYLPSGDVAAIASAVTTLVTSMGGTIAAATATAIAQGIIAMVVATVLQFVLSAVIGALTEDIAPPDAAMGISNSATYTFDGVKNTTYSGAPVLICYGTHRLGGNILNVYTETEYPYITTATQSNVSVNYLYTQIGLCEGEVEAVSDLYINKLPRNFFNGVDAFDIRTGSENQEIIANFNRVEDTTSVGRKITNMLGSANQSVDFSASSNNSLFSRSSSIATSSGPVYGVVESYGITFGMYKIARNYTPDRTYFGGADPQY